MKVLKRVFAVVVAVTLANTFANLAVPPPFGPGWFWGELLLLSVVASLAVCVWLIVWAFDDLPLD